MESLCGNCLVFVRGQKYCSSCKMTAFGHNLPVPERAMTSCAEADDAFKYALIGVFLFSFILEPMAISKALRARRLIRATPTLRGSGKVTASLIVAGFAVLLFLLGLIARMSPLVRPER